MQRPHINADGQFQSDKYPTCPAGKVPLSVEDPTAQELLWEYAQRRRALDKEFAQDLEFALVSAGYDPVQKKIRVISWVRVIDKLIDALRHSWHRDTAAEQCTSAGPSKPHGQCAITALVVQDYLGGALLRCEFPDKTSHYWNLIIGIGEIDLTREQYAAELEIPRGVEVPRARVLEGERAIAARTSERYELLKRRVDRQMP